MDLLQDVANQGEESIILEDSDLANNPYEYNKKGPSGFVSVETRNRLRWIAVIGCMDVRT